MRPLLALEPSGGQTKQSINTCWDIFRKLISLAIHWRIKLYQKQCN